MSRGPYKHPLYKILDPNIIEDEDYKCPRCKVDLEAGIFLDDGYATDDPSIIYEITLKPAKADQMLIGDCWKCPECGFSMQVELD